MSKLASPRTTIWKNDGDGDALVAEIGGLLFDAPSIGARCTHSEWGDVVCIGIETRGSGPNAEIFEVRWRIHLVEEPSVSASH
mgnify:CR=1 FL=1